MDTILIVSSTEDPCTNMVVEQFKKKDIKYCRFDTDLFQEVVKVTLKINSNGEFEGVFRFTEQQLCFSEIGVVWFRRIAEPKIDKGFDNDPALHTWVFEECEWSLNTALSMITAPFVNPFTPYDRISENKWLQMKKAAELGFEVPLSCLTNSLEDISGFWELTKKNMVFKKVRRGLIQMEDGRRILLHTSKIPKDKWTPENLQRMRFYPMFLEEHLEKKYDIRAVVVGDLVFSFAIHSQEVDVAKTDYRSAFIHRKELRHEHIQLGSNVDKKLVSFVKAFGHHFGVIDLILTPDDRLVFLEDNPNGQWAWLESKTGAPIAETTADYLNSLLKLSVNRIHANLFTKL